MDKLEVFVQGKGIAGIALVELASDGVVKDIVTAATHHGLSITENEEPLVWLEEAEEPLSLQTNLVEAKVKNHSRVQVHTCRHIDVMVMYNGQTQSRSFPPSTTVGKVKKWAVREFNLSEADATDHVLQLSGTTTQPTEDIHIGALAQASECSLGFDLLPKSRIQG